MILTYAVHIVAGTLGLIAGYVALYSAKGAVLHRKSGLLFVYAMLIMSVFGMTMAVLRDKAPDINIPAGVITSYMVITSLTTVRPFSISERASRWLSIGVMLVVLAVSLTMFAFGVEAVANGGKRHGFPAFPYFMFATFGALGIAGDLRVLQRGAPTGAPRLSRHLWRMSLALLIAALSFAVQILKFIPKPYRVPGMTLVPVLLVVVTMFYWLWRVRVRRHLRGLRVRGAPALGTV